MGDLERVVQAPEPQPRRTEIIKLPNRGHALDVDYGWRGSRENALKFLKRFA